MPIWLEYNTKMVMLSNSDEPQSDVADNVLTTKFALNWTMNGVITVRESNVGRANGA